jgi:aspartyl-tRNA(Asn)/glutamyl-tRNA(Gln) amidotransferase subunit A
MAYQTASSMAEGLAAGKHDPVDLAQDVFDRLEVHGDDYIYIETLHDRAIAEAQASRIRQRAGLRASPLDGVPIAWKDLFDIAGRVTTAGSTILKSNAPASTDAQVVSTAARAGMITTGLVNMTEMAYSGIGLNPHYGTPRNVHAPSGQRRSPGGSSSGSGVVVSAGIVPISMGSDTGGSIRIPASFNGVVGYKPSASRYPMEGVFPLSPSLDTIGPLAHSVEDCALFDAVLRGQSTSASRPANVNMLDFIIPETVLLDGLSSAVAANFDATIKRLEAAGARTRQIALPHLQEILDLMTHHGFLAGAEALTIHHSRVHSDAAAMMDARVVRRLLQASTMSAVDLVILQNARTRLMAQTAEIIGNAIILCPTTATTAMEIGPLEDDQEIFFQHNGLTLRNTSLGNFLDWCGVSIPNGADHDGMPTGVLLSACSGNDTTLLSAALGTEDIIRG